jgi:hypothetical protein
VYCELVYLEESFLRSGPGSGWMTLMRLGIVFPRGVCEDGAAGGGSGRRAEGQAGGGPVRGAYPRSISSRIRAARGTKFFSKMTGFFSTHCIEVFASIYGS